jgi:hypothetical protein
MDAAERMRGLIHDLSQPLTAAALSVDTAEILLQRGDLAAVQERIEAAARELARAGMMVRILKISGGRGPGGRLTTFDPARILEELLDGLKLPSVGECVGDRDFFEAALAGLILTLVPDREFCSAALTRNGTGVRLKLRGRYKRSSLLSFWLATFRKAGIVARSRRLGADLEVYLSVNGL